MYGNIRGGYSILLFFYILYNLTEDIKLEIPEIKLDFLKISHSYIHEFKKDEVSSTSKF